MRENSHASRLTIEACSCHRWRARQGPGRAHEPRCGIERPAAARIGAQVWLLDRSDRAQAAARDAQSWYGAAGTLVTGGVALGTAETLKEKFRLLETAETEFQEFQINPEIASIVRRLHLRSERQKQNAGYLAGLERETRRL